MARLGVDHIDLIQCHDIEFGDLDQIVDETLPTLNALRSQGKIRFLGVTGYPVTDLAYVAEQAQIDVVLSYCRYTLADQTLLDWVNRFTQRRVGIINASPLSMGLLTESGPPSWHPASPELRDAAGRAVALCRDRGVNIARLALQYAAAPTAFATTIVGTADADNMARNIEWLAEPLDEELANEVVRQFVDVEATWPSGIRAGALTPESGGSHARGDLPR
jgi:L-galactose dehydrogenase